jgi:hypothetical protein
MLGWHLASCQVSLSLAFSLLSLSLGSALSQGPLLIVSTLLLLSYWSYSLPSLIFTSPSSAKDKNYAQVSVALSPIVWLSSTLSDIDDSALI